MKNIAVFASGTGSNFVAIHEAIRNKELDANITLLVSDRPKSKAVTSAESFGLETFTFLPKQYESKSDYEKEIRDELTYRNVELIVLAGYMRLIGDVLLDAFEGRIINIHPSLLPNYKGKDAVGQAMADGAIETGVTVHYVDAGMDTGQIIDQVALDISNMTTRDEIETEIHKIEHKLYKKVIKQLLEENV